MALGFSFQFLDWSRCRFPRDQRLPAWNLLVPWISTDWNCHPRPNYSDGHDGMNGDIHPGGARGRIPFSGVPPINVDYGQGFLAVSRSIIGAVKRYTCRNPLREHGLAGIGGSVWAS